MIYHPDPAEIARMDAEASTFARQLLMPAFHVRKWLDRYGPVDLTDDQQFLKFIRRISSDFGVPFGVAAQRVFELRHEEQTTANSTPSRNTA